MTSLGSLTPRQPLTERQQQVAELIRDGWNDKQIAVELKVSERRVRYIVARIAALWDLDRRRSARVQIAILAA